MSKDEIAYRIRLMFYSIFAIVFTFLFIATSTYLQFNEHSSKKQTDQIKSNILEGLRVREKSLFEEFSTRNFSSIEFRLSEFMSSMNIKNSQVESFTIQQCNDAGAKGCDLLNKMKFHNSNTIRTFDILGESYFIMPMQGWGETVGYTYIKFPTEEISSTPTFLEKILIYILPFIVLGFIIYSFFIVAEKRIIKPTIKRIIETEKIRAQQSIIRQFAHDIQSPLTAMESYFSCAPTLDESSSEIVAESLMRIKRISEDLLEWDRSFVRVDEVDIRKLIEGIVLEKTIALKERSFLVEINIDPLINKVLVNSVDLYRVISNLLNNSIESTDERILIKVLVSQKDQHLDVSISDNGPGIKTENLLQVIKGEYTSKPRGNGLGISGARKWVEKMNGVFKIESQVGLGTTVNFQIPVPLI